MTSRLHALNGLQALGNNGPRILFADYHQRIEENYRAVLAAAHAGDPENLVAQFRGLEREVLEQLAAEEETILPAYEYFHANDAREIREDHAYIRLLLMRLSLEAALHAIRPEEIEALIHELRAYAARDDAHMYRWAQVHLPLRGKQRLAVLLAQFLRRIGP